MAAAPPAVDDGAPSTAASPERAGEAADSEASKPAATPVVAHEAWIRAAIEAQYASLGPLGEVSRPSHGFMNAIFMFKLDRPGTVEGRSWVVARAHGPDTAHWRTEEYVGIEVAFLERAAELGLPTPRVIRTDALDCVFRWSSPPTSAAAVAAGAGVASGSGAAPAVAAAVDSHAGHGVLFWRADGEVQEPTAAHCAPLGAFAGQFHASTRDVFPDLPRTELADGRVDAATVRRCKNVKEPKIDVDAIRRDVEERLPAFAASSHVHVGQAAMIRRLLDASAVCSSMLGVPQGCVHADLNTSNVLWTGTEDTGPQLACVVDWDYVTVAPFVVDIGFMLVEWCVAADGKALDATKSRALLGAYLERRPMDDSEQRALWAWTLVTWLRCYAFLLQEQFWDVDPVVKFMGKIGPVLQSIVDLGSDAFHAFLFGAAAP